MVDIRNGLHLPEPSRLKVKTLQKKKREKKKAHHQGAGAGTVLAEEVPSDTTSKPNQKVQNNVTTRKVLRRPSITPLEDEALTEGW